jgi:hypothetical protein
MGVKLSNTDVIKRIREVHGDEYDLTEVKYKNRRSKIKVICIIHGAWSTRTEQLFRGQGCPLCGDRAVSEKRRITFDDFVRRANIIHNYKYKYFKQSYIITSEKTQIECPKHGLFLQRPSEHLYQKSGCRSCSDNVNAIKRQLGINKFIQNSVKFHGDKYGYSKVNYISNHKKVIISCPIHGDFKQQPQNHMNGAGCVKCSLSEQGLRQTKTTEDFIADSKLIHGDKYDYSLVRYINSKESVEIICKKHGHFIQNARTHQDGGGCQNCNISRGEQKIKRILETNDIQFTQQHQFEGLQNIRSLKCDFYLPTHNMVIEFNGRQHYEPVHAFGGKTALLETQKRDQIKRAFLDEFDINMLEIHYKTKDIEELILCEIRRLSI